MEKPQIPPPSLLWDVQLAAMVVALLLIGYPETRHSLLTMGGMDRVLALRCGVAGLIVLALIHGGKWLIWRRQARQAGSIPITRSDQEGSLSPATFTTPDVDTWTKLAAGKLPPSLLVGSLSGLSGAIIHKLFTLWNRSERRSVIEFLQTVDWFGIVIVTMFACFTALTGLHLFSRLILSIRMIIARLSKKNNLSS